MKSFSKLFTALMAVVMLASCGPKNKFDSAYFSFDIPDGIEIEDDNDVLTYFHNADYSEMGQILLYPIKTDPKTMLHNETIGYMNIWLHDMTFGDIESADIEGVQGWKVTMTGTYGGHQIKEGEVFCADIDNACVIVISVGENGIPAFTDKLIGSIKVKKDAIEAIWNNPAKAVETVVEVIETFMLPQRLDETTTYQAINMDEASKTVNMIFKLTGDPAEFEGFTKLTGSLRDAFIETVREELPNDELLSIPVKHGYSLSYKYLLPESNEPAELITITADDLK